MHAPPTRARKPDSPTLLLLLLLLSPPPHTPHPRWCAPAGCTHVNRVDRQKAGAAACGRQRAAWRQGQAVHLLGGLEAAKELGARLRGGGGGVWGGAGGGGAGAGCAPPSQPPTGARDARPGHTHSGATATGRTAGRQAGRLLTRESSGPCPKVSSAPAGGSSHAEMPAASTVAASSAPLSPGGATTARASADWKWVVLRAWAGGAGGACVGWGGGARGCCTTARLTAQRVWGKPGRQAGRQAGREGGRRARAWWAWRRWRCAARKSGGWQSP